MTLDEAKAEVAKINDAPFNPEDEGDQAALVLLSSLEVGTKVRDLARFTGVPFKRVSTFVSRLKSNGIFKGDKIYADWFDENGGISFTLDVLVATGMMARSR